jgi:RNA polymerase sigma factor (sigma-70 family)
MASVAPEIPVLARERAFEELYRRHVADVYRYALAILRNPADAEDVTQTTFMNAYRAFRRGVEIDKPQNWLIKIAHNVARTRYARASRRVKEVPLEDHVEQLAVPDEERPNVEGVLRALDRLPFNQRAALVMRELEGRSYVEIADTLGVSVAAVETLIFRARRSLKLRASALRSLGAVPLPASLAQLFQGGGGALVGTGFLAKAAVALIAGVVATSIGGGQGSTADAAPRASVADVSQPFAHSTGVRSSANASVGAERRAARTIAARTQRVVARGGSGAKIVVDEALAAPTAQFRPSASTPGPASAAAAGSASASAAAPAPAVPPPVTDTVASVQQTAAAAASAATWALPAQPPSLPPPPPIQPPQPPGLP